MRTSEIPGYVRAVQRADRIEDYWRDFAFLGLNEKLRLVGGRTVEVKLLTLRMFVQLWAVRSPFLVGGPIRPEHVGQFLWRLSPEYCTDGEARRRYITKIAGLPFMSCVRAINRFVDRMLIDSPPTEDKPSNTKHDVSFAASMIHMLGNAYGWLPDQVLDTPIPALFQFIRSIQRDHQPDAITFNPLRDRYGARVASKFFKKLELTRNEHCGKR